MVPPPPSPGKPKYVSVAAPSFPRVRGERRNHFEVQREFPHIFPIGTIVYHRAPSMRTSEGPYRVLQYNAPLYHGGAPQYIVGPQSEPDNTKNWKQICERYLYLPRDCPPDRM